LEVLDLSENLIENVGDCFSQNKKLRKLQLSHNKIREINSLDLKYCKELEISHNELVSIFSEKQSFPMLQRLDLRNNKLQSIGENVSCPELKELYLTSNRLSSLGSILKSATHLNILDIFGNVFKEVPHDVLYLKDITRLDLGNNDITELPPKLGLLTNIKFLRFEGNMIKGIKATKTSDILQILKNRIPINELQDDNISDPFNQKLRISSSNQNNYNRNNDHYNNNSFNNSYDSSKRPSSPKKSNDNPFGNSMRPPSPKKVSDNLFETPSSYLSSDRKVTTQRGYNNQSSLSTDPFGINNLPGNKYSSTTRTKPNSNISTLKKIEFTVSEQDLNIRNLNLSSKNISSLDQECDFESLEFEPETINLSKNLLTTVPNSLTNFSSSLTTLILDFNKITLFPDRIVLPNLIKLSMTHNLINEFPENIDPSQFPKLLELNLSYNNISKLPSNTIPFPALETLILSKNKIESINNPEVFGQLSILDLSDNSINYIPPKLGLCSKLKKLSLEGNTFRVPRYQVLQKGTAAILAYLRDRIPQN
jgi:Leucine-rich repeat (LRR) protein